MYTMHEMIRSLRRSKSYEDQYVSVAQVGDEKKRDDHKKTDAGSNSREVPKTKEQTFSIVAQISENYNGDK